MLSVAELSLAGFLGSAGLTFTYVIVVSHNGMQSKDDMLPEDALWMANVMSIRQLAFASYLAKPSQWDKEVNSTKQGTG